MYMIYFSDKKTRLQDFDFLRIHISSYKAMGKFLFESSHEYLKWLDDLPTPITIDDDSTTTQEDEIQVIEPNKTDTKSKISCFNECEKVYINCKWKDRFSFYF